MADDAPTLTPAFQTEKGEPTAQELADQFAKLAVEYALRPTPDGLDILTELAQRMKRLTA